MYEELNGELRNANFDDKKIAQLYNAAITGRVVGEIPRTEWEMFAVDLIIYYYDKIMATSEDTKTTIYKRLFDCVKHDYDGESGAIIERYRK